MKLNKENIKKILGELGRVAAAVIIAIGLILQVLDAKVDKQVGQVADQVEADLVERIPTQVAAEMAAQHEADRLTPGVPTATTRPGRGTSTPTILPVPTGTLAATLTSIPSTLTPGVSTETPVVVVGLPLCEDHDPNEWHGLIRADGKCHYDHEHKHDPGEGCALATFGEPGAWFGGKPIGYYWETKDENFHKHEAYSYVVRCNIPADSNPLDENAQYTRSMRVQVHFDQMPFFVPGLGFAGGYLGRQHSFSVEAETCRKDGSGCGIIRWGGWLNFGDKELRSGETVITQCVPLIDLSADCPHGPGGSTIVFDNPNFPPNIPARGASTFWYGEQSKSDQETIEVLNPIVIAIAGGDQITDVQLSTLLHPDQAMFCPAMNCYLNGSTISLHELTFNVKANLFDPDGDGWATGYWLVDQYGRFNQECMAAGQVTGEGLMCIPLVMEHVPVGGYKYGDPENMGIGVTGTQDFDVSPAALGTGNEWWITWPVKMLAGLTEHGH